MVIRSNIADEVKVAKTTLKINDEDKKIDTPAPFLFTLTPASQITKQSKSGHGLTVSWDMVFQEQVKTILDYITALQNVNKAIIDAFS